MSEKSYAQKIIEFKAILTALLNAITIKEVLCKEDLSEQKGRISLGIIECEKGEAADINILKKAL